MSDNSTRSTSTRIQRWISPVRCQKTQKSTFPKGSLTQLLKPMSVLYAVGGGKGKHGCSSPAEAAEASCWAGAGEDEPAERVGFQGGAAPAGTRQGTHTLELGWGTRLLTQTLRCIEVWTGHVVCNLITTVMDILILQFHFSLLHFSNRWGWRLTRVLWDMWNQPTTSFQPAAHAEPQGRVMHSEQSPNCRWLDSVTVIDRTESMLSPLFRQWGQFWSLGLKTF